MSQFGVPPLSAMLESSMEQAGEQLNGDTVPGTSARAMWDAFNEREQLPGDAIQDGSDAPDYAEVARAREATAQGVREAKRKRTKFSARSTLLPCGGKGLSAQTVGRTTPLHQRL